MKAFKGFSDLFSKVSLRLRLASFTFYFFFNFIFSLICAQIYFSFDSQSLFNNALVLPPFIFICFSPVRLFVSFRNLLCSTHFIAFDEKEENRLQPLLPFFHLRHLRVGICFLKIVNNKNTINYSPNFMNFYGK